MKKKTKTRKQLLKAIAALRQANTFLVKANKRLKRLVVKDSNTGLFNRRYMEEAIARELSYSRRYNQPFSVIMLDVDYFKSINDAYGHQFGDLVLKHLAHKIKDIVRRYDTAVRFGGEEFIIIAPRTNRAKALALGRRIMGCVGSYNFGDKKCVINLKLSMAISSYPEDGVIVDGMDLIYIADQILRKVKEYGGNQIYSSVDMRKRLSVRKGERDGDIKSLKTKIQRLTNRANQSVVEAVFAVAKTIGLKDRYTAKSAGAAAHYAEQIAKEMNLPKGQVELVRQAAILHDLGKVGISAQILCKKGKLTSEEYERVKKHPQIASYLIKPVKFLRQIVPFVLYHHERWDGKGYPKGLKGQEIPIGARIIAVTDVYQALVANRPYRKAYSPKEALRIIKNGSGVEYDPSVVSAFLNILSKGK
jgi:diguanylate cyclase (GGDEF)-like protein